MTEIQRVAKWKVFVKMVLTGTLVKKKESPEAIRHRKEWLEAEPEKWFKYYFPKFAYAEPASFQRAAATRVLSNPE